MRLCSLRVSERASCTCIQDAFAMVDVDGSGEIDKGELKGLAKMLGMQMSDKDLVTALPLVRSLRSNAD